MAGTSDTGNNVPADLNSGGGWRGIVLDRLEMGPEHVPLSCGLVQGATGVFLMYTHTYILSHGFMKFHSDILHGWERQLKMESILENL